jgi:hypothetical protein
MKNKFILYLFLLLTCIFQALLSPSAHAQSWTSLNDGPTVLTQVAYTRSPVDGVLHVVSRKDSQSSSDYIYHTVSPSGVLTTIGPILSNWVSLTYPGLALTSNGALKVHFSGLRSTETTDPYSRGVLYRVQSDPSRSTWTLDPMVYEDSSSSAYAGNQSSTVLANGNEATAVAANAGLTSPLMLEFGTNLLVKTEAQSCCTYDANVATDEATGETVVGWFSNATGQHGRYFQRTSPTLGGRQYAPGSADETLSSSNSTDGRIPLVARVGGGLFTAYCAGYIPCSAVRVWRYDTNTYIDIPNTAESTRVALARGSEGRIWAFWLQSGKLYAALSNRDVTAFGTPLTLTLPANDSQIFRIAGEGSRGPLDLFVNASVGVTGEARSYHRRVGIPLVVSARSRRVTTGGMTVKVKVTDGGVPIPRSKVVLGRRPAQTTNAQGIARFTLAKARSYKGTVTFEGYEPTAYSVKAPR